MKKGKKYLDREAISDHKLLRNPNKDPMCTQNASHARARARTHTYINTYIHVYKKRVSESVSKTQKWEMHLERECGVWGEIEVDQRGEITMRVEETKRKRRRSSRVRGSTLEEAEQVEEEEDDRVARQVLVQETTVEEVALPLSPLPFYTQTDKLKERDYIAFFTDNNKKREIL